MTDWKRVRIRDVAVTYDGPHATPRSTKSATGGPVFLGISSLQSGRLDLSQSSFLSEDDFKLWTRRVTPQPGDVVFSYETRLGQAAIIPEGLRCALGRRLALMRPDRSQVDPLFLLYTYLGPAFQEVIRTNTVQGSTVDRIMLQDFPNFPIELPSLAQQQAIARTLGSLDDKIESNYRKMALLREIALAAYDSALSRAVELRSLASGFSVGLSGVWGEDAPTDTSSQSSFCLRGRDIEEYLAGRVPEAPIRFLSERQLVARSWADGEIWTAGSGTLGPSLLMTARVASVWDRPITYSNFVKRLVPNGVLNASVAWIAVIRAQSQGLFENFRTGTAMPNLDAKAMLAAIDVPVFAAEDEISVEEAVADALDPQPMVENLRLNELREALLPGLLSGAIRVPEAREAVA